MPPSSATHALPDLPSLAVADLFARADELLPELAVGSAARERDRVMPYDEIRRIADAGLFTFRVPASYGGPGASVEQLFSFLIDLAAVDSNIAQALRPGYLMVESLLAGEPEEDRELWFARILAGDIVGNAGWERGGRNGEIRTQIRRDGDRFLVNGTKSYSTGALFADWVTATATDEDGAVAWFTVPRDRPGLHLLDDWDASGQRLTASGTTELQDLIVYDDEVRRHGAREERRSPVVAVAQLFLGAVLAGIARNARDDAADYARRHARPIVHSAAERSTEDPYVQHAVGEISARAFAAESVVLRAARSIDRALEAGEPAERERLLTEAAIDVAQAQFSAAEAALRGGELLFEVGGASTALREYNLDRHWRNARTVANHNPRAYKAAVVGAYRLTGSEPPKSGLF
jgi:alkylation response protein AidB-like acyl-CoA dehydrogenase